MHTAAVVVVLVHVLSTAAACQAASNQQVDVGLEDSKPLAAALRQLESRLVEHGAREERLYLRSPESLRAFWRRYEPTAPPPMVDFSKYDVALVLMGTQRSGGFSVRIVSAVESAQRLTITALFCRPAGRTSEVAELTSPSALTLVPKSTRTVTFATRDGNTGEGACR